MVTNESPDLGKDYLALLFKLEQMSKISSVHRYARSKWDISTIAGACLEIQKLNHECLEILQDLLDKRLKKGASK